MNRHERRLTQARRRKQPTRLDARSLGEAVDYLLRGSKDGQVVVGPLVWQPSDGTADKRWYFMVATADDGRGFRVNAINASSREEAEEHRFALILDLVTRRPPLVIHDFDDELAMARMCETLWPGERSTRIRQQLEAERAQVMDEARRVE